MNKTDRAFLTHLYQSKDYGWSTTFCGPSDELLNRVKRLAHDGLVDWAMLEDNSVLSVKLTHRGQAVLKNMNAKQGAGDETGEETLPVNSTIAELQRAVERLTKVIGDLSERMNDLEVNANSGVEPVDEEDEEEETPPSRLDWSDQDVKRPDIDQAIASISTTRQQEAVVKFLNRLWEHLMEEETSANAVIIPEAKWYDEPIVFNGDQDMIMIEFINHFFITIGVALDTHNHTKVVYRK